MVVRGKEALGHMPLHHLRNKRNKKEKKNQIKENK